MSNNNFRDLLPTADNWRLQGITERDARQHADHRMSHPAVRQGIDGWLARQKEPFFGVTSDGKRIADLFTLAAEDAPTFAMVEAARRMLAVASSDDKALMCKAIDAPEWRGWSNPELYISRFGVRLDEIEAPLREAILELLRASMSARGYQKSRDCMYMNQFLGELMNAPKVMNEYSYNFLLYGDPSTDEPWGWNFYGHHLCLNCFVLGGQMVISPTFMGAEPNVIDEGPRAGTTIFKDEERLGLQLMRSLPSGIRERVQIYREMKDPAMPAGRWHPADQRHLGGAFQDNRIIPHEGVMLPEFDRAQRRLIMELAEIFVGYLPPGPLAARLSAVERRLDETSFCWIGRYGDEDPFYYRIQSPVVMIEFDHHSGVFLTNEEPAKCHIHTLVRTPNGNDYGKDLLRMHYERVHPGRLPGGYVAGDRKPKDS
jgi:hypothetical protein